MAAQFKEVVVDPNLFDAKEFAPDLCYRLLQFGGWCDILNAQGGSFVHWLALTRFPGAFEHCCSREVFAGLDDGGKILGRDDHVWKRTGQDAFQDLGAFFEGDTDALTVLNEEGAHDRVVALQADLPAIPLPFAPIDGDRHAMFGEVTL